MASELQEKQGKHAKDKDGKAPSKAQQIGDTNRRIVSIVAKNVQEHAEALASAADIGKGQGRAMHAAILALAYASADAEEGQQGILSCLDATLLAISSRVG